jgi:hypothetical protein
MNERSETSMFSPLEKCPQDNEDIEANKLYGLSRIKVKEKKRAQRDINVFSSGEMSAGQ